MAMNKRNPSGNDWRAWVSFYKQDYENRKRIHQLRKFIEDKIAIGSMSGGTHTRLGYSQFLPELAEYLLTHWSKEGDEVLDCFAGRTRAIISRLHNRNYTGYEIAPNAYKLITNRIDCRKTLLNTETVINIINADSHTISDENKYDFIMTCPPYFNIEKYDSVPNQLSDYSDYYQFLLRITEIYKKCHTALKNDRFAVFVVGDFRIDGKFHTFGLDTVNCLKKAGFEIWDFIVREINCNVSVRLLQSMSFRRTVKKHEYVIVAVKGDGKRAADRLVNKKSEVDWL